MSDVGVGVVEYELKQTPKPRRRFYPVIKRDNCTSFSSPVQCLERCNIAILGTSYLNAANQDMSRTFVDLNAAKFAWDCENVMQFCPRSFVPQLCE